VPLRAGRDRQRLRHARWEPARRVAQWSSLDYLAFLVFRSRVFSANMGCKIFIALLLVVLLHFIERSADGWSRRIEHPCAFRATPPPKTPFFEPYQFAAHGLSSTPLDLVRLYSCERRCSIDFGERDCELKGRFSSPWARFWFCPSRHSLNTNQNRTDYNKVLKITDREGLLSVGYPTLARIAISIRGYPRTGE
jgi:hypothetical protein